MFNIISYEGNSNENHTEITLHQLEWQKLIRQKTNVGEDVEKGEPSYTVGGNAGWYSHFGKQYGDSSKS